VIHKRAGALGQHLVFRVQVDVVKACRVDRQHVLKEPVGVGRRRRRGAQPGSSVGTDSGASLSEPEALTHCR